MLKTVSVTLMNERDRSLLLVAVGRRIRAARKEQGLKLQQLALLTGISAPALSRIETGKRDARITTLDRVARALRVSPASLLEEKAADAHSGGGSSPDGGYDLREYL